MDKYLTRDEMPLLNADAVFDVRILTVDRDWRSSGIATLLMYAALRWISSRGERTIVAMGHTEVLPQRPLRESRRLMDPGYGEYAHVTERVIVCHVDRFRLCREEDWRIDPAALADVVQSGDYDLVVVVNPNNPTGRHAPADELRAVIEGASKRTRWWIDEAYLGYVDLDQSLADLAATDAHVVVCTSLSKMFALSGMRAAYVVTEPSVAADLRRWTPPWPVSLPAQMAAVAALNEPDYYRDCWRRTHELRDKLAAELAGLDMELHVDEGVSNFLNIVLPVTGPSAAAFVTECRSHDVYLRDLSPMSPQYEGRTVRIAVKDDHENARIVDACRAVLAAHRHA